MIPLLAENMPRHDEAWPWICAILASGNAVQYGRDWLRERRYQAGMAAAAKELAEARDRHRTDLLTMIPALTRVLDWLNQS